MYTSDAVLRGLRAEDRRARVIVTQHQPQGGAGGGAVGPHAYPDERRRAAADDRTVKIWVPEDQTKQQPAA